VGRILSFILLLVLTSAAEAQIPATPLRIGVLGDMPASMRMIKDPDRCSRHKWQSKIMELRPLGGR
jgi:hypothetical protein